MANATGLKGDYRFVTVVTTTQHMKTVTHFDELNCYENTESTISIKV